MNTHNQNEQSYPYVAGSAKGSDTSQEAADSINPTLVQSQRTVFGALVEAGPMTGDQMAERIGWERWAVRPRLAELKRLGRIRDTGERRVNQASGRRASVWRAVDGK